MRISDWSSDVCSSDLGFGLAAGTGTAEAQVDDLGDVGVVRYAGNLAARGPDDRVGDVTGVAAALPEHAHRQDLGVVGDAGPARCVVAQLGAGGAGNVRAVPRTVVGRVLCVGAFAQPRFLRGPVAQVLAAGGAAVGVRAGDEGIGDEVVARVGKRGIDVGMRGDAGIEHGDHDTVAVGQVPGIVDVAAAEVGHAIGCRGAVGGLQVPLVGAVVGRSEEHTSELQSLMRIS